MKDLKDVRVWFKICKKEAPQKKRTTDYLRGITQGV